jgi:hypothetical protein
MESSPKMPWDNLGVFRRKVTDKGEKSLLEYFTAAGCPVCPKSSEKLFLSEETRATYSVNEPVLSVGCLRNHYPML